jgi:hypothetical protein
MYSISILDNRDYLKKVCWQQDNEALHYICLSSTATVTNKQRWLATRKKKLNLI